MSSESVLFGRQQLRSETFVPTTNAFRDIQLYYLQLDTRELLRYDPTTP